MTDENLDLMGIPVCLHMGTFDLELVKVILGSLDASFS